MFNSKYSKTLTVVLIIVIIAIIGLLIFFGIDVYRKYYIQQAAGDAVEEFEDTQANRIINRPQENIIFNDPGTSVDLNTLYQDNNTITDDNNGDTVTYMGYDVIVLLSCRERGQRKRKQKN